MYITWAGVLAYIAPKNLKQNQIKARHNIKETENQKRQSIIPILQSEDREIKLFVVKWGQTGHLWQR